MNELCALFTTPFTLDLLNICTQMQVKGKMAQQVHYMKMK